MRLLIETEFKRNFKSLLLWTSIVAGLALMMLAMFPAFAEAMESIDDILAAYPAEFMDMFRMGDGGLDMTDPYGWYGIEGYLFVTLIGGSYAAILGSSILSKEEDDSTIEFLLSKPISRNKILLGKGFVILANLVFLNLVLGLVTIIAFASIGDLIIIIWFLYIVGGLILQLIFASIALSFSVFITKSRKVMSMSLGLVMGMYAIDIVSNVSDKYEFLKYITPFEYVSAIAIAVDKKFDPIYMLISFSIILISSTVTWWFYSKKDITV
ncbi:MAG: ABC transporter permease subunit [Candidatus Izimaplasma sp.]|nr:ABC transporter permease subunit [Candidatus Izimaplasma bacterium]